MKTNTGDEEAPAGSADSVDRLRAVAAVAKAFMIGREAEIAISNESRTVTLTFRGVGNRPELTIRCAVRGEWIAVYTGVRGSVSPWGRTNEVFELPALLSRALDAREARARGERLF